MTETEERPALPRQGGSYRREGGRLVPAGDAPARAAPAAKPARRGKEETDA